MPSIEVGHVEQKKDVDLGFFRVEPLTSVIFSLDEKEE